MRMQIIKDKYPVIKALKKILKKYKNKIEEEKCFIAKSTINKILHTIQQL